MKLVLLHCNEGICGYNLQLQLYRDFIFKRVELVAFMGSIQVDQRLIESPTLLHCTSGRASEGMSHYVLGASVSESHTSLFNCDFSYTR